MDRWVDGWGEGEAWAGERVCMHAWRAGVHLLNEGVRLLSITHINSHSLSPFKSISD